MDQRLEQKNRKTGGRNAGRLRPPLTQHPIVRIVLKPQLGPDLAQVAVVPPPDSRLKTGESRIPHLRRQKRDRGGQNPILGPPGIAAEVARKLAPINPQTASLHFDSRIHPTPVTPGPALFRRLDLSAQEFQPPGPLNDKGIHRHIVLVGIGVRRNRATGHPERSTGLIESSQQKHRLAFRHNIRRLCPAMAHSPVVLIATVGHGRLNPRQIAVQIPIETGAKPGDRSVPKFQSRIGSRYERILRPTSTGVIAHKLTALDQQTAPVHVDHRIPQGPIAPQTALLIGCHHTVAKFHMTAIHHKTIYGNLSHKLGVRIRPDGTAIQDKRPRDLAQGKTLDTDRESVYPHIPMLTPSQAQRPFAIGHRRTGRNREPRPRNPLERRSNIRKETAGSNRNKRVRIGANAIGRPIPICHIIRVERTLRQFQT